MFKHDHRPRLADLEPLPEKATANLVSAGTAARVSLPSSFGGRAGYDPGHLGDVFVPFPATDALGADVLAVPETTGGRLDYEHFSVVMSRSRRLALVTAVNIDGSASRSVPRGGDPWALDGRIPADAQAGEELYANNDFDRGHLVRREDPNWGPTANVANRDTFHFTNCAPQLSAFNQTSWLSLEDFVLGNTRRVGERATVFTGPIFRDDDPVYRGVAIPLAFWKVIAFVHDDGRPSASAYMIEQDVDLDRMSIIFGPFNTYQRSVRSIEQLTRLDFGDLATRDGFSNEERATGREVKRVIRAAPDILL